VGGASRGKGASVESDLKFVRSPKTNAKIQNQVDAFATAKAAARVRRVFLLTRKRPGGAARFVANICGALLL